MKPNPFSGLWAGLLLALCTAGLVAGITAGDPVAGNDAVASLPDPEPEPATPTPVVQATIHLADVTASPPPPSPQPTTPGQAILATNSPPDLDPTPTAEAIPVSTPIPTPVETVIGYSVQQRPITAHRIGSGPIKIVLVGDIHGATEANTHVLAQQLLAHFEQHPHEVPPEVSLWIIPTMNPDGLATGHRWNANDVDLNRNADTDLDGCAGNDWSPDTVGYGGVHPGAGGAYPFSEPESRAVRAFLNDASIAVIYHSAAEAIFLDSCQRHAGTARLAEALAVGTGYPVSKEGWTAYPITGDLGDYLAGEGVAAVTVELSNHDDPEFGRNLEGVYAVMGAAEEITNAEAIAVGALSVWLAPEAEGNTGLWQYADNTLVHPIALEVLDRDADGASPATAYILDGGRVLAQTLEQPAAPDVLLAPGDQVEGVRVLEPLDLATDGASLLVLDRAGDVYRYDPQEARWAVERYDRPVRDTYDHYFVALAGGRDGNYLLETTHEQVWRFPDGQAGAAWVELPQSRDIDLSATGSDVYVLTRALKSPTGSVYRYQGGRPVTTFQPSVDLMQPRQVRATSNAVLVLDRAGRRLLALEPESGALLALIRFGDRRAAGAFWVDAEGERLMMAARDALYFYAQPERQAVVEDGPAQEGPQPHDEILLEDLRGLLMPIEGATVTRRDFQMPGAPRHYRLGVHEGIDFYGNTVGVRVSRRTPVRAVADGVVVRALVNYEPITAAQADAWAARSRSAGYTPPEVLDYYRGRQVWIDHAGGLISRYAHLDSIEPGIAEGATVTRGQIIAKVGNSGTPASVGSQTEDAHLHLELWIDGHYIGQFLRPVETREWLERILR